MSLYNLSKNTNYLVTITDTIQTIFDTVYIDYNKSKDTNVIRQELHTFLTVCHQSITGNINNYTLSRCVNHLRFFGGMLQSEKYHLFFQSTNILHLIKNVRNNMYYYIGVLKEYNTIPDSVKKEIDEKLPSDMPEIIKANCMYSLMLQYYEVWTSYHLGKNEQNKELVLDIDKILWKEFRLNSNHFFSIVRFILTNYKPKYNPSTQHWFIGRDGQSAVNSFPFEYLDENEQKVDMYKLDMNELLCMVYKSVYNNKNDVLEDFLYIVYYVLVDDILFNQGNLYNCFQVYLYTIGIINDTYTNNIQIKDLYKYQYAHHFCYFYNSVDSILEEEKREEDYKYNITVKNDGAIVSIIVINNENNSNSNTKLQITVDEFIKTFDLADIKKVHFDVAKDDYYFNRKTLITKLYFSVFVPFIKHKIIEVIKSVEPNITEDVLNYVIKEYV